MALNQSWATRWSAAPESLGLVISQTCGSTTVLGGFENFGKSQTLTGLFPLPSLPSFPSLANGHEQVQVAMEIYFLDSWDGEEVTVRADGVTVWERSRAWEGGVDICGRTSYLDEVFWANFTQVPAPYPLAPRSSFAQVPTHIFTKFPSILLRFYSAFPPSDSILPGIEHIIHHF